MRDKIVSWEERAVNARRGLESLRVGEDVDLTRASEQARERALGNVKRIVNSLLEPQCNELSLRNSESVGVGSG